MVRWLLPDLEDRLNPKLSFNVESSTSLNTTLQSSIVSYSPSNYLIVFFRAKPHQIPSNPSSRTVIVRPPLLYTLRSRFRIMVIHSHERAYSSRGKASPFLSARSSTSSSCLESAYSCHWVWRSIPLFASELKSIQKWPDDINNAMLTQGNKCRSIHKRP